MVQYSPFIYTENIVMVRGSPFFCRENVLMVKYSPNIYRENNRVQLQLCGEFTYCKNTDLGPVYLFEDVEVGVVGDDVLGIGGDSAIDELIVVDILLYQPEMDICLLKFRCVQPG